MGEAGETWRAIVTKSLAKMEFIKTAGRTAQNIIIAPRTATSDLISSGFLSTTIQSIPEGLVSSHLIQGL